MKRIGPALTIAVIALGCGHEERGPTLSGGREIKSWIADLHDAKPKVRRQAVLKLGNAGDTDPAVAEGLAEALRDSDPQVRYDAVFAVMKLKTPGEAVVSRLDAMSRDDREARVRDVAKRAVTKLKSTE